MENDKRYQWLEKRIISCLSPKREALQSLANSEDNKLVILEFLNNEDVKELYVYSKSITTLTASNVCSLENNNDKGIFFIKIANAGKLTIEKINSQVNFFETSIQIFNHIDLLTREVFMPLLCADNASNNDQADKLMDLMHRMISQISLTQSQIEDLVTLPLPVLSVLASAANNPQRRLSVLHILETTLINWQKQIKNVLNQQPEALISKSNFFTKDEIQLWTSCINKLNNLIVQLDAPHVKDILINLQNNNSAYVQSFGLIKNDIRSAIKGAEINLRYISTLTPWVHKLKTMNLAEDAQYLFSGLFHTLLLIWQHSKYYHNKERFAHMLLFLSNEIVSISKEVVGSNILEDPLRSFNKLKEALRICAMFRGTYLDFKEKADTLNSKYQRLDKKIDFNERVLWWIQVYSNGSNQNEEEIDEFEVMRQTSPWPKRNHSCFFDLNVFMERCNDVLELVQTMRHFQILSKTVSIGGAENQNMDQLAQEIHNKYSKAILEFQKNVSDVMNFENQAQTFEISFFHLRTTIKELERELSKILNVSIQHCTTIASKLRLLQVFEGVHERDVIQSHLNHEHAWLISELNKEFENVKKLCNSSRNVSTILPSVITQLMWFHGLEQRIKLPMEKFSYLYPNLLQGDLGYQLRENYRITLEHIEKNKKQTINMWEANIASNLTDKLQQTVFKNSTPEEILSKRPTSIEVYLDFELEKLLKEIHYLKMEPLKIDLTNILKNKFNNIKDENLLRLYANRIRSIADKYNLIMKNIKQEEIPLFEIKLNKIDSTIELGLEAYTWNSIEIPDYIEKAHSIICTDVFQNLELTQSNSNEIRFIINEWCEADADIFKTRDSNVSYTAKELESKQIEFHENIKKLIIRGGNKIHAFMLSTFNAVQISEASPGWQEYLNFNNEIIFNGFKQSSLISLSNMFKSLTDPEEIQTPFVSIDLELVDGNLNFNPPLDENCHLKNLQEILFDFINTFISRGSYMSVLGKNRTSYDQLVANDEHIFELVHKINLSIEQAIKQCKKKLEYFSAYSFLWSSDIHLTFDEFLKGNSKILQNKQRRPPSKNFMSNKNVAKSITSLSALTPEIIMNIERTFLSPYYSTLNKIEKEKCTTPLLEDFDAEISVYMNAREQIKNLEKYQNVEWIKVNLEPTIQVLVTITNKLIWKFTSFLSNQIKITINELESFLKRMEPIIESVTGEERDTATFMKIMRMFNEVSSRQQEMEVKFELMKRTLNLLKKFNRFDVIDLEAKFNNTPIRWSNLKSKVNLAKQRLGPTIQEESKAISQDLKSFAKLINEMRTTILDSDLFDHSCDYEKATKFLDYYDEKFSSLQNQADDLKQLQELLESNIVNFDHLSKTKVTLIYSRQLWKVINDIRNKHMEWRSIRWQKVNIKEANEETEKQLEALNTLPSETRNWDIFVTTKYEIQNIKNCLPIIEEIANPAMRTRHWKQLVRISGSNSLVDNETLKTLTFGQLLELNIHAHYDEVKQIVNKAIKDLSIEQTLKTYEEIWLSKTFSMKAYVLNKFDSEGIPTNDDDGKSSHDRRSTQSRMGMMQAQSITAKSTKRLSIGSLPQSLANIEPFNDNDPLYLFENAENLFAEINHHQIVLEELLHNQSAGSFYDEIIKWQTTLQMIEAVLKEWNGLQLKWKKLESIFSSYEMHTILPQESTSFFKTDKDFKTLMKATAKNNNILKCCQRKNIINILKHLNSNLKTCSDSLIHELSKRRSKCTRFYLLSDEDLIDILCCSTNLENLSAKIGKVFNQIDSLKIDSNASSEKKIVGCYGKNKEYFPLKTAIFFRGSIEDFITNLQTAIPESLRYLLELSLSGNPPPFQNLNKNYQNETKHQAPKPDTRVLQPINESSEANFFPSLFTWTFQHCSQIVSLTMRIMLTKQIETSLSSQNNIDDLKKIEKKIESLIDLYTKHLIYYQFHKSKKYSALSNNSAQILLSKLQNSGIVLNDQQHNKLDLMVKILIYYRSVVKELLDKNCNSVTSPEWISLIRFYATNENNQFKVLIKSQNHEINYGFQYNSYSSESIFELIYRSPNLEISYSYLMNLIQVKAPSLIHGKYTKEITEAFCNLIGYENNFFLCSNLTTNEMFSNVCKSIVLGGYWVTFLNIHKLSSKLMSCLSNILTQLSESNETISINNEKFPLSTNNEIMFFATTGQTNEYLTNSKIDSLKITKIDHYFNLISKDLLDKFKIVRLDDLDIKSYINSNLISNGFSKSDELTQNLLDLIELYKHVLKQSLIRNDLKQDYLETNLVGILIKDTSNLFFDNQFTSSLGTVSPDNEIFLKTLEKNAIGVYFANALFPRINMSSKLMLMNYFKMNWGSDLKIPTRHQLSISNNIQILNLPLLAEKETEMQIEDKIVLNNIEDAVCLSTFQLKLAPSVLFQAKAVNLIENINSHKNLLIVGKSGYGKTCLLKTAINALNELGYQVNFQPIYINTYTNNELFGEIDSKTGSMKEGLISNTLRNFTQKSNYNIMSIVGECPSENMYLYESLFNNDSMFLNHNSEKTNLNSSLRLIWETEDISNLSPAILSSSNLTYLSTSLTSWEHVVESVFIKNMNDSNFGQLKLEFMKKLAIIKTEFNLKPLNYADVIPVTFESKTKLILSIMRSMLKSNNRWNETDIVSIAEYCICNGLSASLNQRSRELFNEFMMKSILEKYPKEGNIYDYFYDIDSHQFQLWSDNIPTFSCPINQGLPLNVFVHTPSTMFLNSMLDVMMNLDESFMIAGETGCGKTSLISDKLKTSCSGDLTDVFYMTINTNRLSNSKYLFSRINHHLNWLHGSFYMPKGNKKMYCFIDDIHQANIDNLNRQSAIEFLRQHLDSERFYDITNRKWQTVKNITYISTFNYKTYSPSNSVSNKILKHFHIVAQHFPNQNETHSIYTKLLYRHLIGDVENESSNLKTNMSVSSRMKNLQDVLKNVVQSSIELNNKMRSIYLEKSQRLHYVFTLRLLTSLFRQMCVSLSPECSKEELLLLWHHECDWLYGFRMIDNVDVERYQLAYKTVVKMNFNDLGELSMLNNNRVYFSNLKENESGIVVAGNNNLSNNAVSNNSESNGNTSANTQSNANTSSNTSGGNSFTTDNYCQTNDLNHIRKLVQISLNEYNKEQQRIELPLYETTINLICRLCHTIQAVGGNCCIVADGGISPFILKLVASLMQFTLITFRISQFSYNSDFVFQQLKQKLIESYYKAGIKGEKVILFLSEEELYQKEFLACVTEFLTSEEVMHLFSLEEETTILNSIRTQVVQAGLNYSKETAWEFFMKNIRENTRIVVIMNENAKKFQLLGLEYPSLFNNMELIWIQHWSMKQLVDNATYHFEDISWLDKQNKENLAHLLASMHNSIRENDSTNSPHLNNLTFTKFVEKFKEFLLKKYDEIEVSHKNICRLLEHIQRQHSTAKKLLVQLQQENTVLEERMQSTDKMLQQIGQDMTMTEQQLRVHNNQTKKTVQLKRILPEYKQAHERNVYKTVAILANTKRLIQNINMSSLQELRSVQKPDQKVEDILASVIIILKSPTADVTWTKGAKRQMANLDRFIEELQSFDQHELTENTIKLLQDFDKKIDSYESSETGLHTDALNTLHRWTKGVLKYNSLMIQRVKPLHEKVDQIEQDVKEADQKLTALNRKSEALNARLKDLAQNFEEATVDKEEQQENVSKMQKQLQTASDLNIILSREFDRNMQVYESLQERILCLPASCALASGFLVYLGPYQFPFRRSMLTVNWVKCLNDRGLPLVLDSLSLIKGRVIKWQMESLSHLLSNSNEISIPSEEWRVHFASDQINNDLFISNTDKMNESNPKMIDTSRTNANNMEKNISPSHDANNTINQNDSFQQQSFLEESTLKIDEHRSSRGSEDSDSLSEHYITAASYRQFIISIVQFIIGEEECIDWMCQDATGIEIENGAIIASSEKHPILIYDPFNTGTEWILSKLTKQIIDLESKNSEDLLTIEKSFQTGTKLLYTNCNNIDYILWPLIFYKNTMKSQNSPEDSKLVFFSNRRLFCNPKFQMYFQTSKRLNTFSPNTLIATTPLSYDPSIENFVDQFQMVIFYYLFPEEYKKRNLLLNLIKECNQKLKSIDVLLKTKWQKDGFQVNEILSTKLALQRKYKIGDVLEYCQEYLANINDLMKILIPISVRASLLMTLSIKMFTVSKNYEFPIQLVEYILSNMTDLIKVETQDLVIKAQLPDNDSDSNESNESQALEIESELPIIPSTEGIVNSTINVYSNENIKLLTKFLTDEFLKNIMITLLPEHRLFYLSLVCFYIKLQEKLEFSDLELEFLMRGRNNTNLSLSLSDFGIPKDMLIPSWIPKENWNDLLAMSLIPGELEQFIIAVISAEKEWKTWFSNPFKESLPKIEMEVEKSSKTEIVELNEFRKLLIFKVMRPDCFTSVLNDYVKSSLDINKIEPDWNFAFGNPIFKTVVINMGSSSNISNSSSLSRIHKNIFEICQRLKINIKSINCNLINLTELKTETNDIKDDYVIFKNVHLASTDIIDYIKNLSDKLNVNDEIKWRIIITKTFDFFLPSKILYQCLVLSFDVIDVIANNLIEGNNKISLDTAVIREETLIFNCIQGTLNLTRNDSISKILKDYTGIKNTLVFCVCLIQGLLQSRQNLACGAHQKWIPWGVSFISQCLNEINQLNSTDYLPLAKALLINVFTNYFEDELDLNYSFQLSSLILDSISNKEVVINNVIIPLPDDNIPPDQFPNWFEEKIPERKIETAILQLHEKQIIYFNTIRAENFIEQLQELWDTSSNNSFKLEEDIQQDWLNFALQMCNDKLPPKLPSISNEKLINFSPENSIAFCLYQEYKLFNENIDLIKNHIENLEKYLLLNTQLFPNEWKNIALALQSQRVPEEWEHFSCRPSVHTLKSWLKSQAERFNFLVEIGKNRFSNIKTLKASVLKQPKSLFSSILLQKCVSDKLNSNKVEIKFEIKEDNKQVENRFGVVLTDLNIIGAMWDLNQKKLIKSDKLFNRLPPVFVYAKEIDENTEQSRINDTLNVYMTHLKQFLITKINLENDCFQEFIPYLSFNYPDDEENQSRRLLKPIVTAMNTNFANFQQQQTISSASTSSQLTKNSSASFSAAGHSMRQSLSRGNLTLQQIREASSEVFFPAPESQLSFKPMTPKAAPLPQHLSLQMSRSKPINQ